MWYIYKLHVGVAVHERYIFFLPGCSSLCFNFFCKSGIDKILTFDQWVGQSCQD